MKRAAVFFGTLGFAGAATAADFSTAGRLAQDEFRAVSEDLGAAFSYKGVAPATALGLVGFDVGVEVTATRVEHSSLFARAGAGAPSEIVIPKVHAHKGLWGGVDIGAFVGGASKVDATLYGAELRYAVVNDGLTTPAVGLRLSGTRVTGLGGVSFSTAALDALVSKRFTLVTPYAGAGTVRVRSSAGGTALAEESFNRARAFAGVNLNLLTTNFAIEAEKMGGNTSLSAKLGLRF